MKAASVNIVHDATYPDARRDESVIDDFFGTKVVDPYRWLEDPFSEETKQFVEAQNKVSQSFLADNDKWQKINKTLTSMWNYPKSFAPKRHGKYYFTYKNTGLQNQKCVNIYRTFQSSANHNKCF